MAHLAQLAQAANSNQLKDMMFVFFERENELDFALNRKLNQLAGQYSDLVSDPDEGSQEDFICGSDAVKVNVCAVSSRGPMCSLIRSSVMF
nr:hypothetical protein [Tanacetum cinerariifolium]